MPVGTPSVSVVLPVRDATRTVGTAVRSILGQSIDDWELLVVDDGSTDATIEEVLRVVAGDPRVRVFADSRALGLPDRLNEAVRQARAPLIARMDGDDLAYPDRLRLQRDFLLTRPDVDLVGGAAVVFRSDGSVRGRRGRAAEHAEICRHPLRGFPLIHPTWMGRAAWFGAAQYDRRASRCEDQELLLRTHLTSRFASLGDVVLGYREDAMRLRPSLRARRGLAGVYLRTAGRHGTVPALAAAAAQGLRAVADVVTVATGQDERRLMGRVTPASSEEVTEWADLWQRLGAGQRA